MLSTRREENWLVDLESKEYISDEKNQHSSIDVTCEVRDGSGDSPLKAAIELKMKKKSSGSTAAVVRCLKDIRRLEKLSSRSYDTGRFLMATNDSYYWEPYNGVGEDLGIHDGREIRAGERLEPRNKTQRKQLGDMNFLMLEDDLRFEWDNLEMDYRFLSVRIGYERPVRDENWCPKP